MESKKLIGWWIKRDLSRKRYFDSTSTS